MPIQSQPDIYKELTYPLCKFLVDKRLSRSGKGRNRAIDIPIAEFEAMLDATFFNVPERKAKKWELLKSELMELADERDASGQNSLLTIESADVLDALSSEKRRTTAQVLRLRYTRVAMQDYVKYLKDGDEVINGANHHGLIAAVPKIRERGFMWTFGAREPMHVKSREGKDARARVCLLLYGMSVRADGKSVSIQTAECSDNSDYKPGDEVTTGLLAEILFPKEWIEENPSRKKLTKIVDNAIRGLNTRAESTFGRMAFELSEGGAVKLID